MTVSPREGLGRPPQLCHGSTSQICRITFRCWRLSYLVCGRLLLEFRLLLRSRSPPQLAQLPADRAESDARVVGFDAVALGVGEEHERRHGLRTEMCTA